MKCHLKKYCLNFSISYVGQLLLIHRDTRHANKHTDLCVPCWHTQGAWACQQAHRPVCAMLAYTGSLGMQQAHIYVPYWHTQGDWACQQAHIFACWHAQAPSVCQHGTHRPIGNMCSP